MPPRSQGPRARGATSEGEGPGVDPLGPWRTRARGPAEARESPERQARRETPEAPAAQQSAIGVCETPCDSQIIEVDIGICMG
eukprot:11490614-Karenia_brevis.AAC.1